MVRYGLYDRLLFNVGKREKAGSDRGVRRKGNIDVEDTGNRNRNFKDQNLRGGLQNQES